MKRMRAIPLALLLSILVAFAPCATADEADDASLHVAEHGNNYELSVPASRLMMTLPKGNFFRDKTAADGASHSSRQFLFEDKEQHVSISGWFEPSSSYSDFDTVWNGEKAAWRSGRFPVPGNEARFRSGGWDGVAYDLTPPGAAAQSANIRAFWIQEGTWIDIHASMTAMGTATQSREKLMALLKSIQITQRR